ncbi:MAG: S-layer homology domain-containing protein [Lachnospiraceae bacterium]|nr:S-layer homology domain-containing protein [Lachnospiraceae bacterium]
MKKLVKTIGICALAISMLCSNLCSTTVFALESASEGFVTQEAALELQRIKEEREIMALVYMSMEYDVKAAADAESTTVATVPSGQTVYIEELATDDAGAIWAYTTFYDGTAQCAGYIERDHLACSDERFLEWEALNGLTAEALSASSGLPVLRATAIDYSDVTQFPTSYQAGLKALKTQHPNWVFVLMNTNLNWNEVVANELTGGKSLVYKTFPDDAKAGAYDSNGNWYYATPKILQYYLDPRNALKEDAIFQFELLTYHETYHTEAAVAAFLNNTFMKSDKNAPGTNMTYAHIIWSIGQEEGRRVSPFHLASRIYQEQGAGTSPLISGTYPGYEGYYNYFNVRATGTSNAQVIQNGLAYAKAQNWNNAYASILGGADVISKNYIQKGQDTLYLQKFNVNPQSVYSLYTHQYMQNISAPTTESRSIRNLYAGANSLDNTFVFKIPVFRNMPGEEPVLKQSDLFSVQPITPKPQETTPSTDILLQIPEGYDTTELFLDGVLYTPLATNGWYKITAPNKNAKTIVTYAYDASGKPSSRYVWDLSYSNGSYSVIGRVETNLSDLAGGFLDVKRTDWYGDAVQFVYDRQIMSGMGKWFRPNLTISREQFVQTLYNNSGTPAVNAANKFSDVKSGQWYTNAVLWANSTGIASGNANGTFGVGKKITREQLALMLYKYASWDGGYDMTANAGLINQYADGAKADSWAKDALNWALTQGIMSGKGSGKDITTYRLDPQGTATRAECATMLMKLLTKK